MLDRAFDQLDDAITALADVDVDMLTPGELDTFVTVGCRPGTASPGRRVGVGPLGQPWCVAIGRVPVRRRPVLPGLCDIDDDRPHRTAPGPNAFGDARRRRCRRRRADLDGSRRPARPGRSTPPPRPVHPRRARLGRTVRHPVARRCGAGRRVLVPVRRHRHRRIHQRPHHRPRRRCTPPPPSTAPSASTAPCRRSTARSCRRAHPPGTPALPGRPERRCFAHRQRTHGRGVGGDGHPLRIDTRWRPTPQAVVHRPPRRRHRHPPV